MLVEDEIKQREMENIKGGSGDGCTDRNNKCRGNAHESINTVMEDLRNHI